MEMRVENGMPKMGDEAEGGGGMVVILLLSADGGGTMAASESNSGLFEINRSATIFSANCWGILVHNFH
jgi:hypothetical protein